MSKTTVWGVRLRQFQWFGNKGGDNYEDYNEAFFSPYRSGDSYVFYRDCHLVGESVATHGVG
jgi:hypothetical protein